jgi:Transposase DDE domain
MSRLAAHALVGAETMVVMAVEFTGSRGVGTHDGKFVLPLVQSALGTFSLKYVLGDKAYLAEAVLGELWNLGVKAVIPLKKGWDLATKSVYYEACEHLARWFDERQAEFHEMYRLRVTIESFYSHLKRVADGYCWSRGRYNKTAPNAETPCTAWINEALCKFIYVNLVRRYALRKRLGTRSITCALIASFRQFRRTRSSFAEESPAAGGC